MRCIVPIYIFLLRIPLKVEREKSRLRFQKFALHLDPSHLQKLRNVSQVFFANSIHARVLLFVVFSFIYHNHIHTNYSESIKQTQDLKGLFLLIMNHCPLNACFCRIFGLTRIRNTKIQYAAVSKQVLVSKSFAHVLQKRCKYSWVLFCINKQIN